MRGREEQGETAARAVAPSRAADPWYDELASGCAAPCAVSGPRGGRRNGSAGAPRYSEPTRDAALSRRAAVYLSVQRSTEFQQVRRSHRRFVLPATAAFLAWYLLYLCAATAAPGLMARPVGEGPFNVGMVAFLGQFLTTAMLTWAYARNARKSRDRAAFELRWETELRTREAER